ncbi:MAG TPA: glycosyltransferase family 4 protein [Longimicrobium sp.]
MSPAPRVLCVDYSLGFGGAIKSLSLTLGALRGHDVQVVTSQDAEIVRTWLAGRRVRSLRRVMNYRSLGRLRAAIEARVGTGALRWVAFKALAAADLAVTAKNAARLAWLLRRERIDLLHLNNGFTPPEALLASRVTGVPCVVHARDFHADRSRAMRWAMRPVARVIAVSGAVAEALDGLLARDRITIVHDPVDAERIEAAASRRDAVRAEWGIAPGAVAVGIVGRVIPWKGQMEFARAALAAMADEPSLHAVVVGDESDGARGYLDAIRALVATSPFAHRFTFAGYRAEVEACYAALDVVVHASITPEPFGMVVPEAMAAGRAVIAADAGGPREVVADGIDGVLVPPGDVPVLAAAMLRLARDADLRARLGDAARAKARERFRPEASAAAVVAVYASVLAGRVAAAPVAEVSHA